MEISEEIIEVEEMGIEAVVPLRTRGSILEVEETADPVLTIIVELWPQ